MKNILLGNKYDRDFEQNYFPEYSGVNFTI